MCHPIGSYYYSDDPTNPGHLFGGVWEDVEGVFLLASQGSVYPAGSTGGSATHTLTVDEMPSHSHRLGVKNVDIGTESSGAKITWERNPKAIYYGGEDVIEKTGGDNAFDIMPPYRAVYCWRRTA